MEIKTTDYNGKTLSFFHNPDGRVRLNTSDFFAILGVNPGDYIAPGEENFIDFEIASPLAFRIDMNVHRWLEEQFGDYEVGALKEGK